MKHFLNNGAQIELKPSPDWSWEGWDGKMEIRALKNTMKISGEDVMHENDVPAFILAPGKSYKAKGFDDIPGIIGPAKFIVDKETLDDKMKLNGFYALLITTTGKFTAIVTIPSLNTKPAVPVPDPLLIKTGTWKVVKPNQNIVFRNSFYSKGFMGVTVSGTVGFVSKTIESLKAILSTNTGSALLKEIEKSPNKVSIVETKEGNSCGYSNPTNRFLNDNETKGLGTQVTVNFNPNVNKIGTNEWETRPPAIGLAHELVHAQQAQNGIMKRGFANNDNRFDPSDSTQIQQEKIRELEAAGIEPYNNSSFNENKIRSEWNPPQPKRKWY